jgi:hypothetical protein
VRPSSGTGSVVERPTRARQQERPDLQLVPVPLPHPRRTLLQQNQRLQSSGHPLRQTPGQLSRPRQTRSRQCLAPISWVHDLAERLSQVGEISTKARWAPLFTSARCVVGPRIPSHILRIGCVVHCPGDRGIQGGRCHQLHGAIGSAGRSSRSLRLRFCATGPPSIATRQAAGSWRRLAHYAPAGARLSDGRSRPVFPSNGHFQKPRGLRRFVV